MIETVYPISRKEEKTATPSRKLPRNIRACGQGCGAFPVYMEDYVETYIRRLSESGFPDSSAAILVGQVMETELGRSLFIRGAINANTVCEGDRPVFSEVLWNETYEKIRRFFPGDEVVGWCIAGPGFRLLQEEAFLRVHIDNFADSEKVFLCYESIEKELVLRISKGGSFVTLPGYYVYYEKNDEMQSYMLEEAAFSKAEHCPVPTLRDSEEKQKKRERPTRKQEARNESASTKKPESMRRELLQLAAIACVLVLIISIMVGTGALSTLRESAFSQKEYEAEPSVLTGDTEAVGSDSQELAFADFDFLGKAPGEDDKKETTRMENEQTIEESEQTTEESEQTMEESEQTAEESEQTTEKKQGDEESKMAEEMQGDEENRQATKEIKTANTTSAKTEEEELQDDPDIIFEETVSVLAPSEYISYIVKKGDMLAQICKEVYGSVAPLNDICELNQLESVDCIYAGQELILPKN